MLEHLEQRCLAHGQAPQQRLEGGTAFEGQTSTSFDDVAQLEGAFLGSCTLASFRLCLLLRGGFGETSFQVFDLVDVRLFPLREGGLHDGGGGQSVHGLKCYASRHVASDDEVLYDEPIYLRLARRIVLLIRLVSVSGRPLGVFFFPAKAFLIPYPAAPLTAPKAAALLAAMAAGIRAKRGNNPPD